MYVHSGITRATWSNYENGNTEPDIKTLANISGIFGVTLDDLILSNLENGNLIVKNEDTENGNVISNPNGNVIDKKKDIPEQEQAGEKTAIWAILGRLARIDDQVTEINGKLDQMRNIEK